MVEEIVAKVNNRIITKTEFEQRGQYILGQLYRQYSGPELDSELRAAQDNLLSSMITELLLLERAENLFDLEKVRKSLIDDFREQQGLATEEDLEQMLREQKITRTDLEEQLLRMAIPQEIVNYDVKKKISVSEREIKEYYDTHRADYQTPPTVTLREIVLFYEPVTRSDVRSRAEGIERELAGGANYEELVQRDSEAGTREAGGVLGPLAAGELNADLARAVDGLKQGEVSQPIDTGQAFSIVRVEERTPLTVRTFAEVHEEIDLQIRKQKYQPRFDRFVRRLWRESQILVMPKYERYLIRSPLDSGPAPVASQPGTE